MGIKKKYFIFSFFHSYILPVFLPFQTKKIELLDFVKAALILLNKAFKMSKRGL